MSAFKKLTLSLLFVTVIGGVLIMRSGTPRSARFVGSQIEIRPVLQPIHRENQKASAPTVEKSLPKMAQPVPQGSDVAFAINSETAIKDDRRRIDIRYAVFFRTLALSPEVESQVKDCIADRDNAGVQVREAAAEVGATLDDKALDESIAKAVSGPNDRIRTLIGNDGFDQLAKFETSMIVHLRNRSTGSGPAQ